MKKLKWLALIAFGCSFSSCDKTIAEEPKVENCIEATCLGVACGNAFFSITDTTKVKGTFAGTSYFSGTLFGAPDMIEKKLPPPYRVFAALFWDSKIQNMKFKVDKTYYFEYRNAKAGEKNTTYVSGGNCFPSTAFFDQIVLLDTLTSKCTRK
jgi:hypothetical protein